MVSSASYVDDTYELALDVIKAMTKEDIEACKEDLAEWGEDEFKKFCLDCLDSEFSDVKVEIELETESYAGHGEYYFSGYDYEVESLWDAIRSDVHLKRCVADAMLAHIKAA